MTNDEKLQEFIVKSTGKTIGRCSKVQLATLFANTYAEYVKAYKQGNEQIEQGYKLYKEKDDKIIEITEAIKDLEKNNFNTWYCSINSDFCNCTRRKTSRKSIFKL